MLAALAVLPVTWCLLHAPRATLFIAGMVLFLEAPLMRNGPSAVAMLVQNTDEIVLIAGALRVATLRARGRLAWWRTSDWTWALVFVGIGVASSIVADVPLSACVLGMLHSLKFILWLLIIRSISWSLDDAPALLRNISRLSFVLLVLGAIGSFYPSLVLDFFVKDEPFAVQEVLGRGEDVGITPFVLPFAHPGGFGWACAVCALASFALALERRSRLSIAGVGAGALGALLSLRRKPLLGIPLAVLAAMSTMRRRQLKRALALCAGGALALGFVLRDKVELIIEDTVTYYVEADLDTQVRTAMLFTGADLANEHFPLGVGFGRFGSAASIRYPSPVYETTGLWMLPGFSMEPDEPSYILDTYWPHLLGEVGWIGTIAMCLFLVQLLAKARSTYRAATDPALRALSLFGMLILIEAIVESVAAPIFEATISPLVLALPLGISQHLHESGSSRVPTSESPHNQLQ